MVYALVLLNVDMGPALMVILILAVILFFAGQTVMQNFAAGLVLQGSPMFAVGDQIVTSAGEGIVKEVTGRTVRIETMDGEGVFIPNKELINEPITNLTELGARRTTFEVGVRYGTDVDLAGRVLEEAAASCDTTHPDPAPEALISEMGDHSIEFLLRFWHDPGHPRGGASEGRRRSCDHPRICTTRPRDRVPAAHAVVGGWRQTGRIRRVGCWDEFQHSPRGRDPERLPPDRQPSDRRGTPHPRHRPRICR